MRPMVDQFKLQCPTCGRQISQESIMNRTPDFINSPESFLAETVEEIREELQEMGLDSQKRNIESYPAGGDAEPLDFSKELEGGYPQKKDQKRGPS